MPEATKLRTSAVIAKVGSRIRLCLAYHRSAEQPFGAFWRQPLVWRASIFSIFLSGKHLEKGILARKPKCKREILAIPGIGSLEIATVELGTPDHEIG